MSNKKGAFEMKFEDYVYERPDLDLMKREFNQSVMQIQKADRFEDVLVGVEKIQELTNELDTQRTLISIRHSVNTKDWFHEQEQDFWNEQSPVIDDWLADYYRAVIESPYRKELEEVLPSTFFTYAENQLKLNDPKIIPLLQEENRLSTEYGKLRASAEIEYKGKTYNLFSLGAFLESTDRSVRKEVSQLILDFYAKHQDTFDDIYDKLVKVRHEMAQKLGFENFVPIGYLRQGRVGYGPKEVAKYRQYVLDHVVPVAQKLFQRQQERLNIELMQHYDWYLTFPTGNATPIGSAEDILQTGVKMYHEMSKETGEFIDFMVEKNLLDLVAKPGKDGGGYCTYIPNYKSPFIFSNFNGTSGDVDVLTHEVGHAFQVYESRWIKTPEAVWPSHDGAEIHSMSMEFFAWPWMEEFFGEGVDKYKFAHLSETVQFLPYGVLVDHFQHEVYENPSLTPKERRELWRKLERQYLPHKEYSENEFLQQGGFWFQQLHIFVAPFYYIDYTLAQVVALQFWNRAIIQKDPNAWEDYLSLCQKGGTKPFLQLVEEANLLSPFEEETFKSVIAQADQYLSSVSEETLN